jgi:hypothetical protein
MAKSPLTYTVAFIAVCCGLLVAIVDAAVVEGRKPPRVGIVADRERQDEERRMAAHFSVTLFSVAYAAGALIYRWLGHRGAAQSLHRWSSWHMLPIHFISIVLLLEGWLAWKQFAVIRPSLVVVVVLMAVSALDAVRFRHGKLPPV